MSIIVFAGQKGGTGKSTLALSTAGELVARRNDVLLVDADPQGSVRTWAAVAAEAGHPAPTLVSMGATMHLDGQLRRLAGTYDFVVIDTPPRHGDIMRSALMVGDLAVLPCGPSAMDAWAMAESLNVIGQACAVQPGLQACIVITRKQARTAIGENARQILTETGLPVLSVELHHRVAYQEAPAAGLGVVQYAPRSVAAQETRAFVDALLEQCGVKHGQETDADHSAGATDPGSDSREDAGVCQRRSAIVNG